jgi:hypothetical protein
MCQEAARTVEARALALVIATAWRSEMTEAMSLLTLFLEIFEGVLCLAFIGCVIWIAKGGI